MTRAPDAAKDKATAILTKKYGVVGKYHNQVVSSSINI